MNIGKLPNSLLEKIVIDPINNHSVNRKEVLLKPSIGEDCAALNLGENICLLSTDPITGAVADIGKLAVNINTNDIASSGGEPIGLMVTALLPSSITEEEISHIITDLYKEAEKVNVAILGGHTEITDAVNKPVLSCTVVGKTNKLIPSGGAKIGDSVIMTKYAAMEGTSIFASDKRDKLKGIDSSIIEKAKNLGNSLSVIAEGRIGSELGANAMHDVTEGGILGALWEMAEASGVGLCVDLKKIPIRQETIEICEFFNINPYLLDAAGCLFVVTGDGKRLVDYLGQYGVEAAVIGVVTEKKEKMIAINELEHRCLSPVNGDEINKVLQGK